jgi:hypothetical protein
MENALIPYAGSGLVESQNNLNDLSGITDDVSSMATAIATMGNSITKLTDLAAAKAEELLEHVPTKEQITPVAIVAGALIGGYLLTGIIANITSITKK